MKAEADGIRAMAGAYTELSHAFGGPQGLLHYLMIKNDTYERLALANAKAINGLQPKITVWNTGSSSAAEGGQGAGADPGAAIRGIFQSLPPLFGTIAEQTGQKPPGWAWNMDGAGAAPAEQEKDVLVKKGLLTNGQKYVD